jgi:hypothetical protein
MEGRDVPSAPSDNLIAIPFYGGRADAAVELVDATYAYRRIPTITPYYPDSGTSDDDYYWE